MPVSSTHAEYNNAAKDWKIMRDVAAGQRAVHDAGTEYLPKFRDEDDKDYLARVKRATFFNATWRTIEGFKGMLFRKMPQTKVSAAVEKMLADVTKSGVDFETFAQTVVEEILTVGRVGVLVDYPSMQPGAAKTVAEVERNNIRPHMAMYKAESIINWSTAWINNRTVLSRVVLSERVAVPKVGDEFEIETRTQYRVLELVEGKYQVRLFDDKGQQTGDPAIPQMGDKPLDFIPFQFFGADDTTPTIDSPPLLDLANVNLSHYRTTADRKHGAHQTAMPQAWIAGFQMTTDANGKPVRAELYMGGGDAWLFPSPDTQVGMLEYTGQGLGTLKEELEREEMQMAVLGARMLEQQKSGVETAETAGIHRSGEQSALATLGNTAGKGFETVLRWFDKWGGGSGAGVATCKFNDEFFPASMTAQDLAELVKSWQAGAISKEALFEKLQRGGVVSDARTFEDEESKIANSPPTLLAPADPAIPTTSGSA